MTFGIQNAWSDDIRIQMFGKMTFGIQMLGMMTFGI